MQAVQHTFVKKEEKSKNEKVGKYKEKVGQK